jgi:hypothetical protein
MYRFPAPRISKPIVIEQHPLFRSSNIVLTKP